MKHLQADLSTYAVKHPSYHPKHDSNMALVYTYQYDQVKSKWTKLSTYRKHQRSLDSFTPIDTNRMNKDFIYYFSCLEDLKAATHCVVTLDKLEAWTAYFMEHPSTTDHIMYKPCYDAYPEYFL